MTPLKWKLPHKTKVENVQNIHENIPKQFFFKNLPYFGPMTSSWHPKPHFLDILSTITSWPQWLHFLGILNKFLQISAFLTTLKYKSSHKTMVGIVQNIHEIIPKQFFPNISHHFRPMSSSRPQKLHFWAIWAIFCRFLPVWPL